MSDSKGPICIWISYRLKQGVSRDEYRAWSREVDRPALLRQPGIRSFEAYEVGNAQDAEPTADFVEVIEADSWQAWVAVENDPGMKDVADKFWSMCDAASERILHGHRITP